MTEPTLLLEYANPLADQPIGSRALCERHEDGGVTYTLPPEGLARAAPGLVVLGAAIVFLLVIVIFAVGLMIAVLPLMMLWLGMLRAAMRPTLVSVRDGRVTLVSGAAPLARPHMADDCGDSRARLSYRHLGARSAPGRLEPPDAPAQCSTHQRWR